MLVKGDKIKNIKQIEGAPVKVGEICEVTAIYNDVIQFKFGNGMHMGSMNQKEYEEYFEKYVISFNGCFNLCMHHTCICFGKWKLYL